MASPIFGGVHRAVIALQGREAHPNIKIRGQFRHLVVKFWEAPLGFSVRTLRDLTLGPCSAITVERTPPNFVDAIYFDLANTLVPDFTAPEKSFIGLSGDHAHPYRLGLVHMYNYN